MMNNNNNNNEEVHPTKKEILKKVLLEGGKGTAIGTGMGIATVVGSKNFGKTINRMNPIARGAAGNITNDFLKHLDKKEIPLAMGLGVGSYTAGSTLVDQIRKRYENNKKFKNKG